MAIDWGTVAEGAGTGALAGAAAGGIGAPFGALIGAGGALLGGLLGGDKPQVPAWQDYTDPRMSAIAQSLMRRKLGARSAARQRFLNSRNANLAVERMENDPNATPAMRAAGYNAANRQAEESNVSANLAGAEQDQSAEEKAANIDRENQQLSFQRNQFAREGYQLNQVPTAFQSLTGTAFANTLGQYVQGQFGKKPTDPTGGNTDNSTTTSSNPGAGVNFSLPQPTSPSLGYQPMNLDLGAYQGVNGFPSDTIDQYPVGLRYRGN